MTERTFAKARINAVVKSVRGSKERVIRPASWRGKRPALPPITDEFSLSLSASSASSEIQFVLKRVRGGLHAEREEFSGRGIELLIARFDDVESFLRWCDLDRVRFDHPLLHLELKREGQRLFERTLPHTES